MIHERRASAVLLSFCLLLLVAAGRPAAAQAGRCGMLADRANQSAAVTREVAARLSAWTAAHNTNPWTRDREGLAIYTEVISALKAQQAAFAAGLRGCPENYVNSGSADVSQAISLNQQGRANCQRYLAGDRDSRIVGRGGAQPASAGGGPLEAWRRRCETLEQRRQNEAASCWGGLAGSSEARNSPELVAYSRNRASELGRNGPQGDMAQETQPIAPGCSADYPIRRTGAACRGVLGAISVGAHTACCVATASLREQLRQRLRN